MTAYLGQQLGNYRLISLIGQGGFADVYLGEHIYLNTLAAIKVLQMRLAGNNLEQFRNEACTIASLSHPNIIRVLDFGVEDNVPYLVMEYACNGTLRQRHPKGSPLSPLSIVPYIQQTASALQYAHDRRLVHRDIKPENMLLGPNNQVLLSDFGLVLTAQSTGSRSTKELGGTAPYMAPEQLQGRPRPASDQYALGIVVYEWLSGDRPFHGTFTEIASQHMLVPPPPLRSRIPDISPEIEQVVLTALAKDPQQRFTSIQTFATAFTQACLALQQHPHSVSYTTIPMDQSLLAAYVIQPGLPTKPNRQTPYLGESAQSTVVPPSGTKLLQPGVVSTPQFRSSLSTNMVQPGQPSRPSRVLATPDQIQQMGNSNGLPHQPTPPIHSYDVSKGTSQPSSGSRHLAWKWSMLVVLCTVIITLIVLLPLVMGFGTSKNSVASGSGTHPALTTTLPAPSTTSTQSPKVKPTSAPALNADATPTPIPTSQPTPASTPVTPTPTTSPPHGPAVTASSLTPSQCSTTNLGWTCTETLAEDQNNTGNLPWSASAGTAGVTFNPSSGTLSPGQTIQVSVAIQPSDCSDTFTFKGPVDAAHVTWNCTLPAPVQLSPASGTVFNNYPRTTTLQWSAVPGAASYTVQIYYYQPGDTTCAGGAQDYLTPNITNTSYTFDFVGAQPGCWKVWAVDAAGRQSPTSGWWEFSYTI
jgi:serine/threonine protein kinase